MGEGERDAKLGGRKPATGASGARAPGHPGFAGSGSRPVVTKLAGAQAGSLTRTPGLPAPAATPTARPTRSRWRATSMNAQRAAAPACPTSGGLTRLLALAGRIPACCRAVATGPHGRVEAARSPVCSRPRTAGAALGRDTPYGEQALGALVETLVAAGWGELPQGQYWYETSAASAAASVHAVCPGLAG